MKILDLKIELIAGAQIKNLNFLPLYLIKLSFLQNKGALIFFLLSVLEMVAYLDIFLCPNVKFKCPKSPILAAFILNHTLNCPKHIFFLQNYCWVEIIKGETQVENLRCRAAMVTKIVKTT